MRAGPALQVNLSNIVHIGPLPRQCRCVANLGTGRDSSGDQLEIYNHFTQTYSSIFNCTSMESSLLKSSCAKIPSASSFLILTSASCPPSREGPVIAFVSGLALTIGLLIKLDRKSDGW